MAQATYAARSARQPATRARWPARSGAGPSTPRPIEPPGRDVAGVVHRDAGLHGLLRRPRDLGAYRAHQDRPPVGLREPDGVRVFPHLLQDLGRDLRFQGHELMTWLGNSARYSVGGVFLALACAVPAGYGLALTQFIGRRVLLSITLLVMIMPASALVLPLFLEMNLLHLVELGLVGGPPVWFLPVRGLPFLHFLLVDDPQGAHGRSQSRRLQRVGGLPLGGAATGPAHSGARWPSSRSFPTGPISSSPT